MLCAWRTGVSTVEPCQHRNGSDPRQPQQCECTYDRAQDERFAR